MIQFLQSKAIQFKSDRDEDGDLSSRILICLNVFSHVNKLTEFSTLQFEIKTILPEPYKTFVFCVTDIHPVFIKTG